MNKLRILLSLFILLIGFQLVLGQNKPFPQALNFPNCIKPNNVTQAAMNTSVTTYYTYWKGKYLKNNLASLPGGYYVLGDITGSADGYNPLGSSEGQGYGMLITVLMAGYDANAQTIFDGLFKTARAFKSVNNPNLMGWVVADAASAQGHFDSATDGDMDIAYSLILAHYQWGSNGAINYLNEAKNMITNGLKASYVTNGNRLNLGDWDSKTSTDTRPSDWMLSHMKAFKDVTGDVIWDNVSTTTYGLINSLQTNYSSVTGLMPDFATGNPVKPAAPNFLESANDGDYYYNACRTPLRFVMDYAHYGNANGKTAVNKIVTWAKTKTGGTPTNFRAGYTLAGNDINGNNYASAVFVAPVVAASTCDAAHQAFLNSGWSSIITMKEGYFEDTYNMLCMLYITGNWWIPQNTLGQSPTVSITSPANNATFTAPASITINATAADADGTISKVEFYNGASLLGTDNTSPYSYSWTNVAAGTYSLTAKATDNSGNATTSSVVTIVVSVPESPYGGVRAAIPGTVEAENYDLGGQGVAYNDVTPANEGGAYRTDAVDIEAIAAGGYNVGYVQAGEWMKYMVNVATSGNYKIEAYVASTAAGSSFTLDLDGTIIGTVNVPNTSGWQTWQVVTINNVNLTAGDKVLRFNATTANFNFDKVVFSLISNTPPTVSLTAPVNNATFSAPASVTINATAADADGTISKVEFYNGTTLLGISNASPYAYTWSGVNAGTYSITAKAYDNSGAAATSTAVSITVSSPGINQYTINKTLIPVTVDGVLNEQDWVNAPFTENLLNMDGTAATQSAKAKMLWDDNNLYFAFIIQDNSIWSTLTTRDAQLWTQDVLEVLIDKDGDGVNYNEIGFAPNGTIYDLLMDKPYSAGGTGTTSWNINGLTVKSTVIGTMNTATGGVQWLVEVALPFSGIPATPATFGKPNAGDVWRLNLARDDHNYNDAASEKLYTWTYTDGVSNHVPSRFGKVTFGAAPNVPPTVSITAPTNSATYTAPASVTINANAVDVDGSISKVEFYNGTTLLGSDNSTPYSYSWTGVTAGTYTITAKAYDNLNLSTTSTAITIVVNNPNVAPTVSITAPTNNAIFTAPASVTINATANAVDVDGSISKVEFYNGTTLLGSDNSTPYSYSWTGVTAGTYTITAKAYDNLNLSTTSTAITIVVNNPNVAPTVSITAPTNNAIFTAPASVTINATANDADGSISKVEFYNGTTLLGSDNSTPYSYSWTGVTAGTYTITAKAYDNLNLSTASSAITIVVNNSNVAPTVSITAPTNNATFTAPASVIFNATANDADGSISKVEFYNGTTLLGSDNSTPYSYSWTGVTAGTYTITAKAYDNLNLSTTSAAITIVINNPNVVPTVSITSPTNNATFTAPASFTINADANDSDGSISKVEFYNGTTLIGSDNSAPYSYTCAGVAAGNYTITAKAYDNLNASTFSSAITIIVSNPNSNPFVTITSSANSSIEVGTIVTITATASDPDGTITNMEIFDGNTKIGELSSGPYVFTLSGLTVGSHSITVVATDNGGGKTTSSPINLNVTEVTGISESKSNDIQLNNYPNPFNYSTELEVTIIKGGKAKIIVYDNYGRELRILADEYLNPGTYTFRIEGDLKPGTYLCKVICDNQFKNLKIVKQ